MYKNRYLLHARIAQSNSSIFIQGHCLAQMKKSVQYKCDIQMSNTGFMEGTHCECAVGGGDTAHCKHVAVLLWAMEEMGRDKKITLRTVCTQKLQSFHKPAKSFFGSPIKAELLPKKNQNLEPFSDPVVLDSSIMNKQLYCEKQRNRAINFAATNRTTMPFLRLFEPANIYCAIWDHDYTNVNPEEQLLNEFKLLSITTDDIKKIEEETREQSRSKSWFKYRQNRITVSNFYKCCIIRDEEAEVQFSTSLINQETFKSKSTDWGKENESKALEIYESIGIKIDKCGLFISPTHPFLGASPDGLIGNDTVVEVKCPYSRRFSPITEKTLPYLYLDERNNLQLKKNHLYYYQIQGQLFVTGRYIANFIVYTTIETIVITIRRDDNFITLMVQRLAKFFEYYFRVAILDRYLYKN
ncbi:uncharacterized protein LOC141526002 [Cotesia typhae]|uniref:uncharacterized protein LOC141526002 n=1 Tax=Cotesia typhae TaxID=2053667 RepID=UPI003D69C976